jgi:hypothetical protein
MSNRDRIAHLRAEADAAAKEKAAAKAEKAARPKSAGRAAAKPVGRVRLVWSVCGPGGKEVERFPYAQEAEARADAVRRTEATGQTHFVTQSEISVT